LAEVNRRLQVLDWFDGFVVPEGLGPGEKRLAIRDRYAGADVLLDQRSVNEGFLFLLFAYVWPRPRSGVRGWPRTPG
jgi:hypothetical protein